MLPCSISSFSQSLGLKVLLGVLVIRCRSHYHNKNALSLRKAMDGRRTNESYTSCSNRTPKSHYPIFRVWVAVVGKDISIDRSVDWN